MITNNNIFKIKKESDIIEIVEDNKDKITAVIYLSEIIHEDKLIEICKDKDIIILIVELDKYEPEGMIEIDKVPGFVIFNKVEKDNEKTYKLNKTLEDIFY